MMTKLGLVAGLSLVLVGCASDGKDGSNGKDGTNGTNGSNGTNGTNGTNGADGNTGPAGPPGPQLALPALYTQTNAAAANQVSSYLRATNGNLSRKGSFMTTGKGTGAELGSQSSLAFDAKTQRFFAVNAGDNTISMLALDTDGVLTAMSTVPSGGAHPVSITVRAGTVYVANQGDFSNPDAVVPANITGYQVSGNNLVAIADSTQVLSSDTTEVHPTDIAFTPDGNFLVVAEEVGNKLDTFQVVNGVAQAGNFQTPAGTNPFAFDFSPDGFLVVANVSGSAPNASTVSSYQIMNDGTLSPITSALATNESAAGRIVMAGDFAYIADTGSNHITVVIVAPQDGTPQAGTVTLRGAVNTVAGPGPIDLAVAPDRGFLYSLAGGRIQVFGITPDGSPNPIGTLPNVPTSASGLVAR